MKFTKEHTMQMKGIAIIILLFHHCFLNAQRWATVPYEKLATTKGWGYYPISFAPFSSHTISCKFFKDMRSHVCFYDWIRNVGFL